MGFFRLDRTIFDTKIWKDSEPYDARSAWIYLIGMANYKDTQRVYRGQVQITKRGQLNVSMGHLAKAWNWSVGRVRRYIRTLEQLEMVHTERTPRGTTITVVNYAKYQDVRRTNGTTDGIGDGIADGTTDGTHKKERDKEGIKKAQEARARAGEPSADLWEDDEEDFGSYQSSDTSNLTDAEKKALLLAWEREAFKMREGNN